ncbi:toll/interleukin-1 receptor domain-containing protein [Haloplasma contractile]|uniref:Toll-Interleukin receptor protein n=1 Tax=Haloplasma contractile SSD-17B TaxID=1033810 RepID=F7PUE3_9MOLU|nr:toll/interleukin-1 receptor domain-containing protein [Haloplasma contractile]ERJ11785.1 Toll-Interleukin receptor protein [Haloplasma contractile SSD-17B]
MQKQVFISYAYEDRLIADSIVIDLEKNDIECWIAPRDIEAGMDWVEAISRAIMEVKIFILIVTEKSNVSEFVKKELHSAVEYNKLIIPFFVEDVKLRYSLNFHLQGIQHLKDLDTKMSVRLDNLVNYVSRRLENNTVNVRKFSNQTGSFTKQSRINRFSKKELTKFLENKGISYQKQLPILEVLAACSSDCTDTNLANYLETDLKSIKMGLEQLKAFFQTKNGCINYEHVLLFFNDQKDEQDAIKKIDGHKKIFNYLKDEFDKDRYILNDDQIEQFKTSTQYLDNNDQTHKIEYKNYLTKIETFRNKQAINKYNITVLERRFKETYTHYRKFKVNTKLDELVSLTVKLLMAYRKNYNHSRIKEIYSMVTSILKDKVYIEHHYKYITAIVDVYINYTKNCYFINKNEFKRTIYNSVKILKDMYELCPYEDDCATYTASSVFNIAYNAIITNEPDLVLECKTILQKIEANLKENDMICAYLKAIKQTIKGFSLINQKSYTDAITTFNKTISQFSKIEREILNHKDMNDLYVWVLFHITDFMQNAHEDEDVQIEYDPKDYIKLKLKELKFINHSLQHHNYDFYERERYIGEMVRIFYKLTLYYIKQNEFEKGLSYFEKSYRYYDVLLNMSRDVKNKYYLYFEEKLMNIQELAEFLFDSQYYGRANEFYIRGLRESIDYFIDQPELSHKIVYEFLTTYTSFIGHLSNHDLVKYIKVFDESVIYYLQGLDLNLACFKSYKDVTLKILSLYSSIGYYYKIIKHEDEMELFYTQSLDTALTVRGGNQL